MIYFDHAAHTPVKEAVRRTYSSYLAEYSGNPEAAHIRGTTLRRKIRALDERLYQALKISPAIHASSVFYAPDATTLINSCGTLCGSERTAAWGSILDHPAQQAMLKRSFGQVGWFQLDCCGQICADPADTAKPAFIVISAVQSECGCLQNWQQLVKNLRKTAPDAVIMLDAVQGLDAVAGKLSCGEMPDLLLISGSKLGGTSAAALLAPGERAGFFQSGFERLRHEHLIGRSDPVAAAALVQAVELSVAEQTAAQEKIRQINRFLRDKLAGMILPNQQKLRLTIPAEYASDRILHFILPGYQAGVLVRMFSAENIMLASGSACESESGEPSRFLRAMGFSKSDAYSGLRLSFAPENTLEEAEIFLQTLEKILKNY